MIVAAADGSSLDNPGPAGWAWYVDDHRWAAGGWPRGTNNMGELMAVLDLLRSTADLDEPLTILCDSQYAINCCTKWLPGWKRKGWRKADGKPVLNRDLLEQIDGQLRGRKVSFEWVKGHAGHALNEAADTRARAAATAFRDGTPVDRGPGMGGSDAVDDAPRAAPRGEPERAEPAQSELFDLPETPASPDQVLTAELVRLERRLVDPDPAARRAAYLELLDDGFVEHGASGRMWTKGRMLAEFDATELPTRVGIEVLGLLRLSDDAVILRWRSRSGARVALRVSVWGRRQGGWRLLFHQGTLVREGGTYR